MVAYHLPGDFVPTTIALSCNVLQDIEGKNNTPVKLEQVEGNRCRVSWEEASVPREQSYDTVDPTSLPPLPAEPKQYTNPGDGFLTALQEASQTAASESTRFALSHIQIQSAGTVVGTDGRQLLLWSGFHFPWQDDLLVPRCRIFGNDELRRIEEVQIGRTDSHVVMKAGSWLVWLPIDTKGRFPKAEDVIPRSPSATRFRLSAQDAAFLLRALPSLPGAEEDNGPITLDLNQTVVVRARAAGQDKGVEVLLTESEAKGKPLRFCTARHYLSRALALGLTEFQVIKPDVPIQGQDGTKLFLWMPLPK